MISQKCHHEVKWNEQFYGSCYVLPNVFPNSLSLLRHPGTQSGQVESGSWGSSGRRVTPGQGSREMVKEGAAQQVWGFEELSVEWGGLEVGKHVSNLAWLILQAGGRRGPTGAGGDTPWESRLSQRAGTWPSLSPWDSVRTTEHSTTGQPLCQPPTSAAHVALSGHLPGGFMQTAP